MFLKLCFLNLIFTLSVAYFLVTQYHSLGFTLASLAESQTVATKEKES